MTNETLNMVPTDVKIALPICKVDKEKRLVYGRATAELIDAHGEVVDFETAKKAFSTWKGNIREMHQPIAVGSAVKVEFNDETKEIFVQSYISKGAEDTWQKILDGTLKDYSIGARAVKKTEKNGTGTQTRLLLQAMSELSVVDSGACPGSGLTIVKMDGETPEVAQELAADEIEPELVDPVTPEPVAKIALVDVRGLASATVAERVAKMVLITGPDAAERVEDVVLKRVEHYDIKAALSAINFLQELVSSEIYELQWAKQDGREVDPEAVAQIELLRSASELVLAFLISEFMSQFDDVAPEAVAAAATDEAKAAIDARLNVVKRVGALLEIAKVGRRHSKTDEQLLTSIHDNAVKLGAACASEKAATPTAADDVTKTVDAEPNAELQGGVDLTKLEGELSTTKAALDQAQATIRSQEESVAKLLERVDRLEAQPLPGGPVSRPVEKAFGNAETKNTDQTAADGREVIKALQQLAEQAETPQERTRIATAIVTKQRELGIDAVTIRTTSGS